MVAKLAVVILVIGAAFAALLVNRQQRIDVVAEISRSQLRMETHGQTIQRLHAAVAEVMRPSELRAALARLPVEWVQIPYRFDPFAGQGKPRMAQRPEPIDVNPKPRSSARERGG